MKTFLEKKLLSKSSLWKSLLKKKLWEEKERNFGEKIKKRLWRKVNVGVGK